MAIAGKGTARVLSLELTPAPELRGMHLILAGYLSQCLARFYCSDDLRCEFPCKLPPFYCHASFPFDHRSVLNSWSQSRGAVQSLRGFSS